MHTIVLQAYDGVMKRLIVANWKMNGSIQLIQDFLSIDANLNETQVVICPPACYLPLLKTSLFALGAQNCHHAASGAFTGEISPIQLKELGCRYVIVGHSERRSYFQETDSLVNQKASCAIEAGLIPIVCIGETYIQRQENRFKQALLSQIDRSLQGLDSKKYVIAYEPVWSIGTGLVPTNEDIKEILDIIRQRLGSVPQIIYGGSVTEKNAQILVQIPNLNGVLVGGASLNLETFQTIIKTF